MSIPKLTPEQLQNARAAAAEARRARAALKADVASGKITLAEALDLALADEVLAGTPVLALLKAVPRMGEKRAAEVMERYEIAGNRRVRGLGHKQIAGLKKDFSA